MEGKKIIVGGSNHEGRLCTKQMGEGGGFLFFFWTSLESRSGDTSSRYQKMHYGTTVLYCVVYFHVFYFHFPSYPRKLKKNCGSTV